MAHRANLPWPNFCMLHILYIGAQYSHNSSKTSTTSHIGLLLGFVLYLLLPHFIGKICGATAVPQLYSAVGYQ